jgi:hypothetical protein
MGTRDDPGTLHRHPGSTTQCQGHKNRQNRLVVVGSAIQRAGSDELCRQRDRRVCRQCSSDRSQVVGDCRARVVHDYCDISKQLRNVGTDSAGDCGRAVRITTRWTAARRRMRSCAVWSASPVSSSLYRRRPGADRHASHRQAVNGGLLCVDGSSRATRRISARSREASGPAVLGPARPLLPLTRPDTRDTTGA